MTYFRSTSVMATCASTSVCRCCPCFARFVSVAATRASNCVTASALSPLRISRSQAARMNACSDRKPRSFDAFLTSSRNSLLGNSRLRSVLGFAIDFLPFRLSKCRETWKNMRWHICATLRAKVATSLPSEKEELASKNTRSVATTLYVPIRVSVPDNPPAFHARCSYSCRRVSNSAAIGRLSGYYCPRQRNSADLQLTNADSRLLLPPSAAFRLPLATESLFILYIRKLWCYMYSSIKRRVNAKRLSPMPRQISRRCS